MTKFYSTKRIGPISTGHRQWRDDGHCAYLHGYGRYIEFTFGCSELDHRQWCMPFGDLKDVKKWLEKEWDHRTLISSDDPLLSDFLALQEKGGIYINVMDVTKGWGPGIEGSCKYVFDHVDPMIKAKTGDRVWIEKVHIFEHENNSAIYVRDKN